MEKKSVKIASIFIAVSAVVFLLFYFGLLDVWQEKILDKFFIKRDTTDSIVIFAADNESIAKIGQWPWPRSVFADTITHLQSAKAIAIDINFSEPSTAHPSEDLLLAAAIKDLKPPVILPVQINPKTKEITEALPILKENSLQGKVNIINEDGVARSIKNIEDGFSGFGAIAALQFKEGLFIPEMMRIDYAGPEKTFATLPLIDLLENKVPETVYKNKVVLIGATAPDLHDFFQTPFGFLPGVEIHANIAEQLIRQAFYKNAPWHVVLLLILCFNALAALAIIRIKKLYFLLFCLAAIFGAINLLAILLFSYKIILPVLYLDTSFVLLSASLIIFQYISESAGKKFIYESFKYYLSPEVINEIIQDPKKLKLGGERKKITVLFSDIRGFTSISETLSPEELAHILNEYLTEMADIIMKQQGLVDKYIGDAIMAFWGAPIEQTDQAKKACASALAMVRALEALNRHWQSKGILQKLEIGIGINTGQALVGNLGSKKRFNYTALGDSVNLASRLEGLNKEYGTTVIITESAKKELENNPELKTRKLDTIMVKGKKEPAVIFELLTKELDAKILEHFEKGKDFYKKGNWQEAINEFSVIAGQDSPSQTFLARCRQFQTKAPASWNGVYEFKNK